MVPDPIADVIRELLVRQVGGWAPLALQRSRRATFVHAYGGVDGDAVTSALAVFAELAESLRGRRLTVVVLAAQPGDLATRLGAGQAELPAEVSVHLVPGAVDRLPVAVKAAGAAGAPLLAVVDAAGGPAVDAAALAAVTTGRPAELLLMLGGQPRSALDHRAALSAAGFPLVTEVELMPGSEPAAEVELVADAEPAGGESGGSRLLVFGTSSGKRLEAFKDAIWEIGADAGVRVRDPREPGAPLDLTPTPALDRLGAELLARLATAGRCSVSELRQFTVSQTVYRAADTNQALGELLAAGLVTRDPAAGRLGGDVLVDAVQPVPGQPPAA